MIFGIEVICISFPLHPRKKAPFRRGHSALCATANGVRALFILPHTIPRFGSLEGEWQILVVGKHPFVERARLGISPRILAGIYEWAIGQAVGVYVVAAAA